MFTANENAEIEIPRSSNLILRAKPLLPGTSIKFTVWGLTELGQQVFSLLEKNEESVLRRVAASLPTASFQKIEILWLGPKMQGGTEVLRTETVHEAAPEAPCGPVTMGRQTE